MVGGLIKKVFRFFLIWFGDLILNFLYSFMMIIVGNLWLVLFLREV